MSSFSWALAGLLVCGCASTPRPVIIPEPGLVLWNQCHRETVAWCRAHPQSRLPGPDACEQDRANEFAGLLNDTARREYLGSHGCHI
jgi:hypothetical protein